MATVAELRKAKNKVRITHRRHYATNELFPEFFLWSKYELNEFLYQYDEPAVMGPLEIGGETIVEITTPNGKSVSGIAKCNLKDHYCRRIGLELALNRALNALNIGEAKENV